MKRFLLLFLFASSMLCPAAGSLMVSVQPKGVPKAEFRSGTNAVFVASKTYSDTNTLVRSMAYTDSVSAPVFAYKDVLVSNHYDRVCRSCPDSFTYALRISEGHGQKSFSFFGFPSSSFSNPVFVANPVFYKVTFGSSASPLSSTSDITIDELSVKGFKFTYSGEEFGLFNYLFMFDLVYIDPVAGVVVKRFAVLFDYAAYI